MQRDQRKHLPVNATEQQSIVYTLDKDFNITVPATDILTVISKSNEIIKKAELERNL